jgi:hypothetical protein
MGASLMLTGKSKELSNNKFGILLEPLPNELFWKSDFSLAQSFTTEDGRNVNHFPFSASPLKGAEEEKKNIPSFSPQA